MELNREPVESAVAGQDMGPIGGSVGINERWEIARRVTLDPIISTVDPDVGVIALVALTDGGGPGDGDVASGHRPTNTRRWTAQRGGSMLGRSCLTTLRVSPQPRKNGVCLYRFRAEGVGFEPTRHFCPPVFKTGSIGRSDSPPEYKPSLADAPNVKTPTPGNRLGSCCDFDSYASRNNYQVD